MSPNEPTKRRWPGSLTGEFVELRKLDAGRDAPDLYPLSHGSEEMESVWTYMGYGPFRDAGHMQEWMASLEELIDPRFYAVVDLERSRAVGMASFLNIEDEMRRIEMGHIWYATVAQRTRVNTEAAYLMLQHAFEGLGCRRVEWKCDSLNDPSRAAALRLGFAFEGIFRQHMIVRGRNRDTAGYAMLDSDWAPVRKNLTTWLYEGDGSRSLERRY